MGQIVDPDPGLPKKRGFLKSEPKIEKFPRRFHERAYGVVGRAHIPQNPNNGGD
jgi:hypothetical protein